MSYDNPVQPGFDDPYAVTFDAASVKEAQEADLIPAGWYRGRIVSHEPQQSKGGPYQGMTVIHCRLDLTVNGRTRPVFPNLSPIKREWDKGGIASEYVVFGQLVAATQTTGKTVQDTLEQAMLADNLEFRVSANAEKGRNDVKGVRVARS